MLSTISLLNEDFDRYVCNPHLQKLTDEVYTSTGRQVTAPTQATLQDRYT